MKRALLPLLLLTAACDVRPARFADAPPVEVVADDRPVPLPRSFEPVSEIRISEAYLRRPLIDALDPARVPEGGDVNALDEVPRSSWFSPGGAAPIEDADDPPEPPLHPLAARATGRDDGLRVVDARGRFYEVFADPPDRPEMATGAAAAASRILRALGYPAPGVWVRELAAADFFLDGDDDQVAARTLLGGGRRRVALTRWPVGIDLGPTHAFDRRANDPNDRVAHLDRRTLRALSVFFEWLGISRLDGGVLRDAYVGAPGAGHVVHWVVDASGAFGADAVVRSRPADADDFAGRNVWVTIGTFGLYAPALVPTQRRWLSIGAYDEIIGARPKTTSPPFAPMDRLLPSDAYWAAKRLVAVAPAALVAAVDAGRYTDAGARARLLEVLGRRRSALVARAFAAVTPCEVEAVLAGGVVLRDEAVLRGFASAAATRQRLALLDSAGRLVAGPREIAPRGATFLVPIPASAPPYVILQVTTARDGGGARRAMEAHFVRRPTGWALVGVQH